MHSRFDSGASVKCGHPDLWTSVKVVCRLKSCRLQVWTVDNGWTIHGATSLFDLDFR